MNKNTENIYLKGIANLQAVYPNTKNKRRKTFLYYIVETIIPPKKSIPKEIFFVHVKNHRNDDISKQFSTIVYRGNWFYNISEFRKEYTFSSSLSRICRLKVWFFSIFTYKKKYESFSLWLDFNFLNAFLDSVRPYRCLGRSHYDEFATWISGFSEIYNFSFEVYQHGVLSKQITIPYKIKYSKIYVFDMYSENIFKENYILNDNCQFEIYPFKPSVIFESFRKEPNFFYVGIIEQKNPDWVNQVLYVLSKYNCIKVIIMKHPLSTYKYESAKVYVTNKKYSNLDLIIAYHSTLIIDYKRALINTPIVCTNINMRDAFSSYVDFWSSDFNELNDIINNEIKKEVYHVC